MYIAREQVNHTSCINRDYIWNGLDWHVPVRYLRVTVVHFFSCCILYLGILWNATHIHNIVAPVDQGNNTPWGTTGYQMWQFDQGIYDLSADIKYGISRYRHVTSVNWIHTLILFHQTTIKLEGCYTYKKLWSDLCKTPNISHPSRYQFKLDSPIACRTSIGLWIAERAVLLVKLRTHISSCML